MRSNVSDIDRLINAKLARLPHPQVFVRIMSVVTLAGSYALVWQIAAAWISWRTGDFRWVLFSAAGHAALFILIDRVIKPRIRRPRPSDAHLPLETVSAYSFPSGHAASSAFACVLLSRAVPEWIYLWLGLAGLIVFSRLYLLRHYLSDVIASLLLGAVAGWGMLVLLP